MKNSNSDNHNSQPEFSCQSRLGLVLYGGVSLAIYMNGICQEFYNAVRGRGIYKLIKAVTDSDIIIDIISGTSAGGINGVFLSYALANSDQDKSFDFNHFANIWRESGDIDDLLRNPDQLTVGEVNSILDGENYYQTELEKVFRNAQFDTNKEEWYSDFRELDLFVTGTDLLGKIEKTWDNLGNEIEIKNHQTVFHLKSRKDVREFINNPFAFKDEITSKALAKLCRITSCFPLAFPVVEVKVGTKDEVDCTLVEWGQLKNRLIPEEKKDNYPLYFVDGGVLDNRPFSYTISEIASRQAYQPVERKLFYIDPNPEEFEKQPEFIDPKKPNVWEVVLDSLITLPSYESIDQDLKRIKDLNQKVNFYTFLRQSILKNIHKSKEEKKKAVQLFRSAFLAGDQTLDLSLLSLMPLQKLDDYEKNDEYYLNLRLLGLLVQLLPKTSKIKDNQTTKQNEAILKEISQILSKQTFESLYFLQKYYDCLEKIDLNFTYRKHCFLIYTVSDRIKSLSREKKEEIEELQCLQYKLTWQLELIKVMRESLEDILFSIDVNEIIQGERKVKNIANFLIIFLMTLLAGENFGASSILSEYFNQLDRIKTENFRKFKSNIPKKQKFSQEILKIIYELPICNFLTIQAQENDLKKFESKIKENFNNNNFETKDNLISKIDAYSETLVEKIGLQGKSKDFIQKILTYFPTIDATIYPYEALADLKARSLIQLVRISPNDTKFGFGKNKKIADKLTGYQFRAFGGFFKKSWRSNDLLWGRLDGLNYLVEALVTQDSLKNFKLFIDNNYLNSKQKTKAEYINWLVDNCLQDTQDDQIKQDIKDFLNDLDLDQNRIQPEKLAQFRENLIMAGHKEILKANDLNQVIEDSFQEESFWHKSKLNPTLNALEAAKRTRDLLGEDSQNREYFFTQNYIIPQETILSVIPKSVSNSRLEKTVSILLDMLVSSFPHNFWLKILRTIYVVLKKIVQGIGKWIILILAIFLLLEVILLAEASFTLWDVIVIIITTILITIAIIFLFVPPLFILPLLRRIVLNLIIEKKPRS